MAEFFSEYGLFLLESITIVVAIVATVAAIIALGTNTRLKATEGHIEVKSLNDEYDSYRSILEECVLDRFELKNRQKERKEQEKHKDKALETRAKKLGKSKRGKESPASEEDLIGSQKRLFVIEFDGDIRATQEHALAKEVTAILQLATPEDEVLVRLESPGGVVHGYGLAASQLARIKERKIPLTVAVDKVAASGGYMMACLADKIIAAPFAIIGSIGVLAQLPNFNRLLKKHEIDYDIFTAGEYKRTVTVFGENSEKGRQKFQDELEETHLLFKDHVATYRSQVEIEKIATGEHWYGKQAADLNLIDELMTSEEYLTRKCNDNDIYQVNYVSKKPLIEKLSEEMQGSVERIIERVIVRMQDHYLR